MSTLSEVQSWMAWWGWKGDPATGFSHKEDGDGNRIAEAHGPEWIADTEEACAKVERMKIFDELERRAREHEVRTPPETAA